VLAFPSRGGAGRTCIVLSPAVSDGALSRSETRFAREGKSDWRESRTSACHGLRWMSSPSVQSTLGPGIRSRAAGERKPGIDRSTGLSA
jgi:hypothetical protein